jgi:hypothetical protein
MAIGISISGVIESNRARKPGGIMASSKLALKLIQRGGSSWQRS